MSDSRVMNVGRLTYVLALLPLSLMFFGIFHSCLGILHQLRQGRLNFIYASDGWMFQIFFWAYVLFIMVLSSTYRDFALMKVIFVYPGMLSCLYFFTIGCSRLYEKIKKYMEAYDLIFVALSALYAIGIVGLIIHLLILQFSFIKA
jgi:hypothetical protein